MRFLLISILFSMTRIANSRPQDSDLIPRQKRDATVIVETTEPTTTFQVERLDAPIERIEIRLMDEHNNVTSVRSQAEVEASPAPPKPTEHPRSEDDNRTSNIEHKYKKAEYIHGHGENNEDDHSDLFPSDQPDFPKTNDISANAWLSFSTVSPTKEFDDDVIQLPPDVDVNGSSDDELEPVEECLNNKDKLPDEVVERLEALKQKLGRMIRRLNKQLTQYCTHTRADAWTTQASEYRQCPNWREEKMVQYYKLMRISYCSDMSQWPNAQRVKREFEPKLHLYETMYAFQKSEIA